MAKNTIKFKWKTEEKTGFSINISFDNKDISKEDNFISVDWGEGKTDIYNGKGQTFYWLGFKTFTHDYSCTGEEFQVTIQTPEHCDSIGFVTKPDYYCPYNINVTELDLSCAPDLITLDLSYLSAKELDVSQNTKLKWLSWNGENITKLDLSNNLDLEYFSPDKPIAHLDLSKHKKLKELYLCDSTTDYSHCLALETLQIIGNSIDVSNLVNLKTLFCCENELTALDVSKNPRLKHLHCHDNNLTELDLSNNPNLKQLDCYGNPLTSLKLHPKTFFGMSKKLKKELAKMGFDVEKQVENLVDNAVSLSSQN